MNEMNDCGLAKKSINTRASFYRNNFKIATNEIKFIISAHPRQQDANIKQSLDTI